MFIFIRADQLDMIKLLPAICLYLFVVEYAVYSSHQLSIFQILNTPMRALHGITTQSKDLDAFGISLNCMDL